MDKEIAFNSIISKEIPYVDFFYINFTGIGTIDVRVITKEMY